MFEFSFFSSLDQFLIIGLIILASQFVYSALGFGSGMVAISLLTLLYGNLEQFLPFFILLCIPTELFVSFKNRKNINFKKIRTFLVYIIPSLLIGTFMLKNLANLFLQTTLGLIITLLSLYFLFFENHTIIEFKNKIWVPAIGLTSGILGALFGVAGPPLIVYFKSRQYSKEDFRIILLSIFFIMSIFRVIFYTSFKLFTQPILISSLLIYPFAITGMIGGNIAFSKIPEKQFRQIPSLVLLASGILLVIKGLR